VECITYRWGGQTLRDPDKIRPPAEKQAARANCPVDRYKKRLLDEGVIDEGGFELMVADVRRTIDTAQSSARGLPSLAERVRESGIDAMERFQ
jgi:pyruvate dehydrogenase E1 component alpha subunit